MPAETARLQGKDRDARKKRDEARRQEWNDFGNGFDVQRLSAP